MPKASQMRYFALPGDPTPKVRFPAAIKANELQLGFSNTTRKPEGTLNHNNRKS
jgi:hypothetical protein